MSITPKKCVHCGSDVYSGDLICFYCNKEKGIINKAEIYDKEMQKDSPTEMAFSELLFGKINYRTMRRRNLLNDF